MSQAVHSAMIDSLRAKGASTKYFRVYVQLALMSAEQLEHGHITMREINGVPDPDPDDSKFARQIVEERQLEFKTQSAKKKIQKLFGKYGCKSTFDETIDRSIGAVDGNFGFHPDAFKFNYGAKNWEGHPAGILDIWEVEQAHPMDIDCFTALCLLDEQIGDVDIHLHHVDARTGAIHTVSDASIYIGADLDIPFSAEIMANNPEEYSYLHKDLTIMCGTNWRKRLVEWHETAGNLIELVEIDEKVKIRLAWDKAYRKLLQKHVNKPIQKSNRKIWMRDLGFHWDAKWAREMERNFSAPTKTVRTDQDLRPGDRPWPV